MSQQKVTVTLDNGAPDKSRMEFGIVGMAPTILRRAAKTTTLRSVPGSEWKRLRTLVDEESCEKLLLAQELFVGALRDRWGDWFRPEHKELLDDAEVPVVAINRRGERVATLLSEGDWPEDRDTISARLTRAVFDGEGLAVVWSLRPDGDEAPAAAEDTVAEPEAVEDAVEAPAEPEAAPKSKRDAANKNKKKKIRELKKEIARLTLEDSDSD